MNLNSVPMVALYPNNNHLASKVRLFRLFLDALMAPAK